MRILVAIDDSRYSEWAVDALRKLPLTADPEITVCHVVEHGAITHPALHYPASKRFKSQVDQEIASRVRTAERLTEHAADRLRERWAHVETRVEKGNAAETIIDRAQELQCDLIVLGAQGRSDIEAFLLGSVSFKIATYAPCSVLVIKQPMETIERILLAVDGSAYSDRAASFLANHVDPTGLDLRVLTVVENRSEALEIASVTDDADEVSRKLTERGFTARASRREGHAAEQIAAGSRDEDVQLVVVGARGLTGLRQFFLGSVSHKTVKYCDRAVLVVRDERSEG